MTRTPARHLQLTKWSKSRLAIVFAVFLFAVTAVVSAFIRTSSAAVTTPVGIFTGHETPGAEDDGQAVELGMRFYVTVPGSITALRYYRTALDTGPHTGTLWSRWGAALATVTYDDGPDVGWQTATLSQPVQVTPGHTYVVSYHTDTGYYAQKEYAFTDGQTLGASYIRGVGGVYNYGAHQRPTLYWHESAYYVDALFQPASSDESQPSQSDEISPSETLTSPPPSAASAPPAPSSDTTTVESSPPSAPPSPSQSPTSASPTASGGAAGSPPTTGFPDASDTGVAPGTTFVHVPADATSGNGWSWVGGQESCIHVTDDGATLTNLSVAGCVEIYANNVTISNVLIQADGDGGGWGIGIHGYDGATIEDTTIGPATPSHQLQVGIKDVTGSSTVTILRNDISGWSTGIQVSSGLVQDNYVHDPVFLTGDHINGFTDNGGRTDGTMVVRHNTFLNTLDQADAVSFFEDFGVQQNVTVDDNLLAGGSYSLYAGHNSGGPTTNHIVITDNHFSTRYFATGGTFGPACCFDHGVGNVWSGNVWQDGLLAGQAIEAPYND